MQLRMRSYPSTVRTGFAAALLFLLPTLFGCAEPKKAYRWILPSRFEGWIVLVHRVKGAPPLPIVDGFKVVQMPISGKLETSGEPITGEHLREECYFSDAGQLTKTDCRFIAGSTIDDGRTFNDCSFFGGSDTLPSKVKPTDCEREIRKQ